MLTPKYHFDCCAESRVEGQTGNLLFKVKVITDIGVNDDSVITNTSNTIHFCLVSFLLQLKWKLSMVFATSSYSQCIFFSHQNSLILHHRWAGNTFCCVTITVTSFQFSNNALPVFVSQGETQLHSCLFPFALVQLAEEMPSPAVQIY